MDRSAERRTFFLKVATIGALLVVAAAIGSAATGRAAGRPADATAAAAAAHPPPAWPRPAWVAVPMASVWDHRGSARTVDAADVSAEPRVAHWLAGLSLAQRLGLDYRLATQALLDDPLTVLGESGGWARVLVDGQRGSVYPHGAEGWVPVPQITFHPLPASGEIAMVSVPFAYASGLRLSYGTELPVTSMSASDVSVSTEAGTLVVRRGDVRIGHLSGGGGAVVREAERFLGLPYLWAGTSAYGLDCSGLTYLVYRQFGVTLPRDAADQARAGRPVARADLAPGDLVFFDFGHGIDHVGIYAGNGMMVDSPKTGSDVEVVALWKSWLAPYYAGARRYLQ